MACPLCVVPPLAAVCSALGIQQTAEVKYGASAAGGAAMLGVAWMRRNGCKHKGTLRRLNIAGGAAMLAYAVGGYAYESTQAQPAKEGCTVAGADCECA